MSAINSSTGKCEVCRVPVTLRCTGCNFVFYCGKTHQKEDWKNHRKHCLVNKVWQIRISPKVGLHIVALRDIKGGEFIMSEEPYVTGPRVFDLRSPPLRPPQPCCIGCCKELNPDALAYCPQCKWPICTDNCSRVTDENYHGRECFLFKFLLQTEKFPPWAVILPLRCLLLQKFNPQKWKCFQEMAVHADAKLVDRTKRDKWARGVFNILRPLKIIALELLPDFTLTTLKQVSAVLDVYAICWSPKADLELASLYPAVSFLQHSCLPNAHLYNSLHFPNSAVQIRSRCKFGSFTVQTLRNVPKGEVLTTSWISVISPTQARQSQLRCQKNIQCFCERCLDPRELGSDFGTMKCSLCSGWMLPVDTSQIFECVWKCEKCRVELPSAEVVARVLPAGTEFDNSIENATVDYLKALLTKFEKDFHPNHFLCYKVKLRLLKAYGSSKESLYGLSDQELNSRAELCRNVLDIQKKLGLFFLLEEIVDYAECALQLAGEQIELMKRACDNKSWDADRINRCILECRTFLQGALDLWKHEPPSIPEHIHVATRIEIAIYNLEHFVPLMEPDLK